MKQHFLALTLCYSWACHHPHQSRMSRLSRDRIMRATLEPFVLLLSWLRVRIVTFHRHQIAYAGIIHFHESGRAYRFHATLRSHLPLLLVGAIRLRFPVHLVDG